ncbi:hypothetical protein FACS1894189_5970 [Planctomycetales bacterium]|nr:hypothetical protein FACS1894189_5970 [Planctomycetales bacterium]
MLRFLHYLTALYAFVLTLLLLLPDVRKVPHPHTDAENYTHIIIFSLLAFLVELGRRQKNFFFWAAILFVYAFLTEVLQGLLSNLTGRMFDWNDIQQNFAGILLGLFLGFIAAYISRRVTS